jgi:hypothetical protein
MLTYGGLSLCASVLALAALLPLFRAPNARPSLTVGWLGEVITIAIVCAFALGVGFLVTGTIHAYQEGPNYVDLGLVAGVLLGSLLIWRKLDVRKRLRAIEEVARAADASVTPMVAVATSGAPSAPVPESDPRSNQPPPSKPTRPARRAA